MSRFSCSSFARSTHTVPVVVVVPAAPVVPTAPAVADVELVDALPIRSSICADNLAITALSTLADALAEAAAGVVADGVWVDGFVCVMEPVMPLWADALAASSSPTRL